MHKFLIHLHYIVFYIYTQHNIANYYMKKVLFILQPRLSDDQHSPKLKAEVQKITIDQHPCGGFHERSQT